jgi:predicted MPP superfamily phosphohydrolase
MLFAASVQMLGARQLVRQGFPRPLVLRLLRISLAFLACAQLLLYLPFRSILPAPISWIRGAALLWAVLSALWLAGYWISGLLPSPEVSPSRRRFLSASRALLFSAPAVAAGYGVFVERFKLNLREQRIALPNLPAALDGLRIVQLTDIHMGPFLGDRELQRAIDLANKTKAHLALMTGDLISDVGDPLDLCIDRLAQVRTDLGLYGCLGNHERYADAEDYTAERAAKLGMTFLRGRNQQLKWNGAVLNLAGVDYQRMNRPYLTGAETLVDPAAFNLLLSHNPDVFPVAKAKGFDLTISGHTHGGQVRAEILHRNVSIARFFTPYVDGLYRNQNSAIFVSRGIGTIGLPARLGAPPEVALITLCRTSS